MKNKYLISIIYIVILFIGCKENPVKPKIIVKPDTTSHNIIWHIDTLGDFGSDIQKIWGTDENNVYAVGLFSDKKISDNYLSDIARWDGEKWEYFRDHVIGCGYGVYGFNKNDVWVVGDDGGSKMMTTHWDGSKWNNYEPNKYNILRAVWGSSPNNVYAVGDSGLIMHYNGTVWKKIESGTKLGLKDIWGTGADDIYAVGFGGQYSEDGIMLYYNGKEWQKIFEANSDSDGIGGQIQSIYGYDSTNYIISTSTGNYKGRKKIWDHYYLPNDNNRIFDIKGTSAYNIFCVGHFGFINHWNGKSWHRYDEFYKKNEWLGDKLWKLWVNESNVFITGRTLEDKVIVYRGKIIK